jgi:hypothetical protein
MKVSGQIRYNRFYYIISREKCLSDYLQRIDQPRYRFSWVPIGLESEEKLPNDIHLPKPLFHIEFLVLACTEKHRKVFEVRLLNIRLCLGP